jgi:hypothetical protein
MHIPTLLSLLLLPLTHALSKQSSSFSLQIIPSPALPNPSAQLPPSTHATLSSLSAPPFSAPLTSTNSFVFRNVSAGSYLVDVHCATHVFAPLRVDVDQQDTVVGVWDTFRGNDWDNRGEAKPQARAGGFEIRAFAGKNHFMERPRFSVLSILKNPMILIAIFGGAMFMVMPYLMDNMDPEMRAEFEASQKSNPMAALLGGGGGGGQGGGFDMAEYLSGAGASKSGGGGDGGNNGGGGGTQKGKNKAKK